MSIWHSIKHNHLRYLKIYYKLIKIEQEGLIGRSNSYSKTGKSGDWAKFLDAAWMLCREGSFPHA